MSRSSARQRSAQCCFCYSRCRPYSGHQGLRIGVVRKFHKTDNRADPAALRAIEDAIAIFRTEGAEIRDVALPSLDGYRAAGFVIPRIRSLATNRLAHVSCCQASNAGEYSKYTFP